jgi:hypothetical protein
MMSVISLDERLMTLMPDDELIVTKSGRTLTDADVRALVDEAEAGYDVSRFKDVRKGRCVSMPKLTMPERKNFLGIPIDGDIQYAESKVPQRPLEDLAPIMQAVLDDESVKWFGWRQYTPYFNDGEPCVFRVCGELAVYLTGQVTPPKCIQCLRQRPESEREFQYCPQCGRELPKWAEVTEDCDPDDVWNGVEYGEHLGKKSKVYDREKQVYVYHSYVGDDEARYDHCMELEQALASGAYDDVLLEHFGDHATIRVARTGIKVDVYSHD